MTKLYELSKELQTINDEIITAEGEINPQLEVRLDQVNLQINEKAQGLRKWMAMIAADKSAINAEIDRLINLKRLSGNLETRLMDYMKKNMEVADLKKIETPIGTFRIQKNPPSVEIVPEAIPDDFMRVIPEKREPDKKKILDALQEGYDVPGAKLITDKTHLRVS